MGFSKEEHAEMQCSAALCFGLNPDRFCLGKRLGWTVRLPQRLVLQICFHNDAGCLWVVCGPSDPTPPQPVDALTQEAQKRCAILGKFHTACARNEAQLCKQPQFLGWPVEKPRSTTCLPLCPKGQFITG